MNKKTAFIAASAAGIILVGLLVYMTISMKARQEENEQMIEVLKMDKAEMENEYEQFAMQYNEMMAQINNDSLVEQLSLEQERINPNLTSLCSIRIYRNLMPYCQSINFINSII